MHWLYWNLAIYIEFGEVNQELSHRTKNTKENLDMSNLFCRLWQWRRDAFFLERPGDL